MIYPKIHILGQLPTKDNSPPDEKPGPDPQEYCISEPGQLPAKDHYHRIKPLMRTKTLWWGIVLTWDVVWIQKFTTASLFLLQITV